VWDTPGLVKNYYFRPSVRTELFARFSKLDKEERRLLLEMVHEQKMSDAFQSRPAPEKRDILDTAMDYMDYQNPGAEKGFKTVLLNERSKIDLVSDPLVIVPKESDRPHLSHGSRRLGLSSVTDQHEADYLNLEVKFALHDQLDFPTGYPDYAEIDFGDFNFTYTPRPERNDRKLDFESFKFFEIVSHSPYSPLSKTMSWQIKVGLEKLRDENCYSCHAAVINGGAGYTFELSEAPLFTFFAGLKGQLSYTPYGSTPARFVPGAGPALRARFRWNPHWVSLAEAWYRQDAFVEVKTYQEYSLGTQWSPNKNWGVRLSGVDQEFDRYVKMDFYFYY
jgi:hypothetical protein